MIRDAYYYDIYNYLRKKNDNITENRYPKRITDIKAKDKRDNAKKEFRHKTKSYKIDKEINRLLYKKIIIILFILIYLHEYYLLKIIFL